MAGSKLTKSLALHAQFFSILLRWPLLIIWGIVRIFWAPRKDVSNDTVLITGAASGIGKLMAQQFSQLGSKVVLWDVNEKAVKEAAAEIAQLTGQPTFAYVIDLKDRAKVYELAARVKQEVGPVSILVNNAGIVTGKKILEAADESMVNTMNVNAIAHFWTIKSFLPEMLAANHGHIVTIASSAGHIGVSGLLDYCASKHAAVGIDESLRFELRKLGKFGVKTTCVNPYFIGTGMFDGARTRWNWILPILSPQYAASKIVNAVLTNQEVLFMPRFLYLQYLVRFIVPVSLFDEISEWLGTSESMDHFVGRAKQS